MPLTPAHAAAAWPLSRLMQHASTVIGFAAVTVWGWRWIRRQPAAARAYRSGEAHRAARTVAILLGVGAAGACLNGLRGASRGFAAVPGYAAVGGMAAPAVALLVFGFAVRQQRIPETG
ncbi:MAG TPA: DUF4184 family protein [Gemmatimonadales bacterium]